MRGGYREQMPPVRRFNHRWDTAILGLLSPRNGLSAAERHFLKIIGTPPRQD